MSGLQGQLLQLRALIIHSNDSLAGLMFVGGRHSLAALRNNLQKYSGEESYSPSGEMNVMFETGDFRRVVAYASR